MEAKDYLPGIHICVKNTSVVDGDRRSGDEFVGWIRGVSSGSTFGARNAEGKVRILLAKRAELEAADKFVYDWRRQECEEESRRDGEAKWQTGHWASQHSHQRDAARDP